MHSQHFTVVAGQGGGSFNYVYAYTVYLGVLSDSKYEYLQVLSIFYYIHLRLGEPLIAI